MAVSDEASDGAAIVSRRLGREASATDTVVLEGHERRIGALVVLADGRLASGAYDNTVRLWDIKTGAEVARLEGHTAPVLSLDTSPTNRSVLVSSAHDPDKSVRITMGKDDCAKEIKTMLAKLHSRN